MEILRYASAEEFLAVTQTFRGSDSLKTGLITSIATSVAEGKRTYENYFWWAVIKDDGISGIAIRTVPFGYVFSHMDQESAHGLFSAISTEDPEANEFAGPKSVIDYLESISDREVSGSESELIYANHELKSAPQIGETRKANLDDFECVYSWMQEFMKETHLRSFNLESIVRSALSEGRYTLLVDNGIPVSLGGNSDIQHFDKSSIARVGPIYTPERYRKSGYASAITSAITAELIAQGATPTLYTQADNPTSNKIYQEIGYTLIDQNRKIIFAV
jgi:predicted GNAT family acetyltransferase